jgi:hypothetical protein
VLEIIEVRYDSGSMLPTSQVPIDRWHDIVGNPTLADAILDRVIHNAYRIELAGGSMVKRRMPEPIRLTQQAKEKIIPPTRKGAAGDYLLGGECEFAILKTEPLRKEVTTIFEVIQTKRNPHSVFNI